MPGTRPASLTTEDAEGHRGTTRARPLDVTGYLRVNPGGPGVTARRVDVQDYVVRVYRRGRGGRGRLLVGVVEEVGVPGRRAFGSVDELWAILASPAGRVRPRRGREVVAPGA